VLSLEAAAQLAVDDANPYEHADGKQHLEEARQVQVFPLLGK